MRLDSKKVSITQATSQASVSKLLFNCEKDLDTFEPNYKITQLINNQKLQNATIG